MRIFLVLAILLPASLLGTHPLRAQDANDRHSGYYYPPAQSEEVFQSLAPVLGGVNRRSRAGLVAGLNKRQIERQYDSGYHVFAKGTEAEKLIIVATQDGRYDTLYRLRALLAALTSEARLSPLFSNSGSPENLTFLDLLKMGGFTQVTVSNGKDVSHTIVIR